MNKPNINTLNSDTEYTGVAEEKLPKKPLVFSCSGCSNLGEMAHNISLTLDGDNIANMSCVAAVTANTKPVMDAINNSQPIITIDGCELSCTKVSLENNHVTTDHYFNLSELGFKKQAIWNDSLVDNNRAIKRIYSGLIANGISVA